MNEQTTQPSKASVLSVVIFFLCCWYLLLCTTHYLRQRPLWLDEQSVFKSLVTFQPRDFFRERLYMEQVFPRFYLFLIQQISRPFDFNLLALRFFPFISMITAFFIWLRIAKHEFKDQLGYLTFVLCWNASALLIYYSAELKPYSTDVLAVSLFIWFLYQQKQLAERNSRTYFVFLMLLPLLGLFSYPVFLLFVFPVYNMLLARPKPQWGPLSGYCISAAAVMAFVYFFDLRVTQANRIINVLWMDHFISFQSVGEFFKTFGEGTMSLFSRWFAERPRIIKRVAVFFIAWGLVYIPYGFFKDIKKHKLHLSSINVLAFLIYGELFLLGALQKYPFTVPRTSLFFCPIVLMMTVKGIVEIKRFHVPLYRVVHSLFLVFLVGLSVGLSRIMFTQDFGFAPKVW